MMLIALLGGLGGAINAALAYLKFPPTEYGLTWSVIPAGAVHGAVLAILMVVASRWLARRRWWLKLTGSAVAGWAAGWLSWIPMELSLIDGSKGSEWGFGHGHGLTPENIGTAFVWPLRLRAEILYAPYLFFGLVALCGSLVFAYAHGFGIRRLGVWIALGVLSGVLGSLWWWAIFKPWYLGVLHGTIWGALVGFGIWKAQRLESAVSENIR